MCNFPGPCWPPPSILKITIFFQFLQQKLTKSADLIKKIISGRLQMILHNQNHSGSSLQNIWFLNKYLLTRSLGALRPLGPDFVLYPFGCSGRETHAGDQLTQPTQKNLTIFRKYRSQVVRNTVWSFGEIHLTKLEKYSKKIGGGTLGVTENKDWSWSILVIGFHS